MGMSVAIHASSSPETGNTAQLLAAFMRGVERGGDTTRTFAIKDLNISPCTGELHCWFKVPGQCYIQDDMQNLYPVLRESDTLILATPVYIPMPGEMQNLLNRLCPLMEANPRDPRRKNARQNAQGCMHFPYRSRFDKRLVGARELRHRCADREGTGGRRHSAIRWRGFETSCGNDVAAREESAGDS